MWNGKINMNKWSQLYTAIRQHAISWWKSKSTPRFSVRINRLILAPPQKQAPHGAILMTSFKLHDVSSVFHAPPPLQPHQIRPPSPPLPRKPQHLTHDYLDAKRIFPRAHLPTLWVVTSAFSIISLCRFTLLSGSLTPSEVDLCPYFLISQ